jgi:histone deacetylase complex regulatory component SIN3
VQTYQRESKSIQELYSEIGALFHDAPDLIEDFKKLLPETAAHARAQAAALAQATVDGLEAAVGEITAECPTVESQILAPSPTSYGRTLRGASASFVPDDTETLPKPKDQPTKAALDRLEQQEAGADIHIK